MNYRTVLPAFALLVCCAAAPAAELPDTSRMNVLFIDIEDCTANAFGSYGNPICKTPHIDRLAATGVRFDRAYCQYVCCNPSRSSFLTGLRPHTTRVLSNAHNSREKLPSDTLSLPQLVHQKGLYLANVAKLFHHGGELNAEDMIVFDRLEFSPKPPGWKGPGPILTFPPLPEAMRPKRKAPKRGTKEWNAWRRWHSDRYGDSGLTAEYEYDRKIARTAIALLKEFSGQERHFFLSVGSGRPHTPLICPKHYLDMYDPAAVPLPAAPPEKDRGVPDIARRFGRSADIFLDHRATDREARAAIAAYYACVTFVDEGIGMILDALEKEGLAEKTIVIFFSDHGFHLGEHGLWSKYTLFEQSTRVPLIVRVPGAPGNGRVCHEIVELVDLVPTIGELIELELPKNLEGTSFVPLLIDPVRPWKKAAFTVFGNQGQHGSVRTKRYKYAEWQHRASGNQGEKLVELYDLQKDPWETVNLADDPAQAAKRRELAELYRAGWKAALPPK